MWVGIESSLPEYRAEAVKLVIETSRPIAEVARDLGINEGTLGNWVLKYRNDHPISEELTIDERAKLEENSRRRTVSCGWSGLPEKSGGLLREPTAVTAKFVFIAAEKAE